MPKLEINDLVWAKMRGYSTWPAMVVSPPHNKSRSGHLYVYFFGSKNYGFISRKMVFTYRENISRFICSNKTAAFRLAVEAIARHAAKVESVKLKSCHVVISLEERKRCSKMLAESSAQKKDIKSIARTEKPGVRKTKRDISQMLRIKLRKGSKKSSNIRVTKNPIHTSGNGSNQHPPQDVLFQFDNKPSTSILSKTSSEISCEKMAKKKSAHLESVEAKNTILPDALPKSSCASSQYHIQNASFPSDSLVPTVSLQRKSAENKSIQEQRSCQRPTESRKSNNPEILLRASLKESLILKNIKVERDYELFDGDSDSVQISNLSNVLAEKPDRLGYFPDYISFKSSSVPTQDNVDGASSSVQGETEGSSKT